MNNDPIVIAGAGPVGLALAFGLSRYGIRSIVIEKKSELSKHSKALAILARTVEILECWKIAERFKTAGDWRESIEVGHPSGKIFFEFNFDVLHEVTLAAGVCILPQNETERLLYDACMESRLVEVRFGHEVSSFKQESSGISVQVTESGNSYVLTTRFLCGCDGPRSQVREVLGLGLEGKTYPAHAVLADVLVDDVGSEKAAFKFLPERRGLNAFVRFGSGISRLVVAEPGEPPSDQDEQRVVVEKLKPFVGAKPVKVLWSSSFRIHCRNANSFRVGNVLLLGDAAHLNSPAGGQGMNSGIQDAHNLAWKLATILNGAEPEAFLKSYDQERQDAVRNGVDRATDRLTTVGILMPPWLRQMVIAIFGQVVKIRPIRRYLAKGAGMLGRRQAPSELIDESGGHLYPTVAEQGCSLQSRIVEHEGDYLVVRPDNFIAYRGKEKSTAENWVAKISTGI